MQVGNANQQNVASPNVHFGVRSFRTRRVIVGLTDVRNLQGDDAHP